MEPYDLYAMTAAHKSLPLPTYVRVTNLENNRSAIVKVNDRGPFVDDRVIDLSYAAAVKLGYAEKGTARVKVEAITSGDAPMITRGETRHSLNKAPVSALAARPTSAPKPAANTDKNEFLLANSEPTAAGSITAAPAPTASTLTSTSAIASSVASNVVSNAPLQIAMTDKQIFLQAGAFSDQQAAHNLQSRLTQVVSAPVKVAKNDNTHFRVHVGPFSDESTARQALAQIRDSQLANPLLIRR
jgi:rare lipoprotein A